MTVANAPTASDFDLSATVYQSGNLLEWVTERYVRIAFEDPVVVESMSRLPAMLTHASACTGTGVESGVLDTWAKVISRKRNVPHHSQCLFDAEANEKKRLFIRICKPQSPSRKNRKPCQFENIESLSRVSAPCYEHGCDAEPPSGGKQTKDGNGNKKKPRPCCNGPCNIWIACTSCKYFHT